MDTYGHIKTQIDTLRHIWTHILTHIDPDLDTYGHIWTHKDTHRHIQRHT